LPANRFARTEIALGILTAASLLMAGCASPGTRTGAPQAAHDDMKAGENAAALPNCDGLETETVSHVTDDGIRVEQQGVRGADGVLILHGVTTHWWKNGQKKLELHHRCGVKHGSKKAFFPNGDKWNEGGYVDGKGDGAWREWYNNGHKSQEFTMDHGAWNGVQRGWHSNGVQRLEVDWVAGRRQGLMQIWDEQGTLRRTVEFVDGDIQPSPLTVFGVADLP